MQCVLDVISNNLGIEEQAIPTSIVNLDVSVASSLMDTSTSLIVIILNTIISAPIKLLKSPFELSTSWEVGDGVELAWAVIDRC